MGGSTEGAFSLAMTAKGAYLMDAKIAASQIDTIRRHDLGTLIDLLDEIAQAVSSLEKGDAAECMRRMPEVAYVQGLAQRVNSDLGSLAAEMRGVS